MGSMRISVRIILNSLTPLISSEQDRKDTIKIAILLAKQDTRVTAEKTVAILYTMADKFLQGSDLEEIKEDLKMWKIGKILMNEGKEEGERQTTQKIVWNMKDDFSVEQIAMATNLTMSEVSEILNDTSKSVQ